MLSFFQKKVIFTLLFLLSFISVKSQCFEIESILVDACGSPEGENEMLRFKVGPNSLDANDISVTWASANSWLGICQNTASANATTNLNNTITSCGLLIEPTGGILPANSTVLFMTSTAIDANANSFANLDDTLYVIYQCAGNTGGHFGNYSPSFLLRTVTMSFSTPSGCSDQVTYNKSLLLNQNLQSGGTAAIKNGGIVNFDPAGNDTYDNNGCQAPYNPTEITAINTTSLTICPGDDINLTATTLGSIQSVFWTGNNGTFSSSNNLSTTYSSSFNDITPYHLIIGGVNSCNDTIFDSLLVTLNPANNVSIIEDDTINLCQGETTTLHATGSSPFLWNTGETTDSISVSTSGNYYVSASGNCPSNIDTVFVNTIPQLTISINEPSTVEICDGNSFTLNASGGSSYLWSTGETSTSINVNSNGIYTVTSGEACPSNIDSSEIIIIEEPTLAINNLDSSELCLGEDLTLNATGSESFVWNTGATSNSIIVNTEGLYFVTSTNNCFSISDSIYVVESPQTNVAITEPNTTICANESITLHATGAPSFLWSTGSATSSITVSNPGIYSVTSNETCQGASASVTVSVIPQVTISIQEGNSIVRCSSATTTLNASSSSSNYLWNTGETTSSIDVTSYGTYVVETTNGNCPSGFDSIVVIPNTPPEATIIGENTICDGYELALYAEGSGDFSWSNGDSGSSTNLFTEGTITLSATNSCNEIATDTKDIVSMDCSTTIYIPNSFTPNGDHINDYFKVEGTNIQSFNGQIFNRWGELLYEWNNTSASWDGTYKGKKLSADTFIYKIKVELLNNNFETFTGKLSLLQ